MRFVPKHMERREELSIDEVFSKHRLGYKLSVFKEKGLACVKCGSSGTFFALERHAKGNRQAWHLNLYAELPCGGVKLMTVDHIIPKSKGGAVKDIDNLQPMCASCNRKKDNFMPDSGEGKMGAYISPYADMSNKRLHSKIRSTFHRLQDAKLIYIGRWFSISSWFRRIKRRKNFFPNKNDIKNLRTKLASLEVERELRRRLRVR